MTPQAVLNVVANELRQQVLLARARRLPDLDEEPGFEPAACHSAVRAAQWGALTAQFGTPRAANLPRRCYTAYQGCVYEAVARQETMDLAPHYLRLTGEPAAWQELVVEIFPPLELFREDKGLDRWWKQVAAEVPGCVAYEKAGANPWRSMPTWPLRRG